MTARKDDSQKLRMDLMSVPALRGLSAVLTHGAKKYEDHNWRKGMAWSRLIGATLRHLTDFMAGQDVDPDSGLPVIDHVQCCVHFLSEYRQCGLGTDDRWRSAGLVGGLDPKKYRGTTGEAIENTIDAVMRPEAVRDAVNHAKFCGWDLCKARPMAVLDLISDVAKIGDMSWYGAVNCNDCRDTVRAARGRWSNP